MARDADADYEFEQMLNASADAGRGDVDKVMIERMAAMERTMSDLRGKISEAGAADHGRALYN